jgi:hypothetical protein
LDASIKILDVDRMLAKSNLDLSGKMSNEQSGHPVIRTLYDHVDVSHRGEQWKLSSSMLSSLLSDVWHETTTLTEGENIKFGHFSTSIS